MFGDDGRENFQTLAFDLPWEVTFYYESDACRCLKNIVTLIEWE